jgi:hydrogenase expression/formation protein HypE
MPTEARITLDHGSGGTAMRKLIADIILSRVSSESLADLADSAVVTFNGQSLAYTTDSYVVQPLFFPGGDIGKLAVCGTVNDLLVVGAKPRVLSLGLILEEGLPVSTLEQIMDSIAATAKLADVKIVTGDTKVVPRGKCDMLFINTSGIGTIPFGNGMSSSPIVIGDKILVSGTLGEHALAILGARESNEFTHAIQSDCAPLVELVESLLMKHTGIKWMRDATRGGVAAVLDELSAMSASLIEIDESSLPVQGATRSLCELLGFDPLHLANEGKIVLVAEATQASGVLQTMKTCSHGEDAAIIGEVIGQENASVIVRTPGGGHRRLRRPTGELLPRIC